MASELYLPTECALERFTLWPGQPHEMAFRLIPPGRFRMGARGEYENEEPRHWVRITRAFWMAETPVTQAQYRHLAGQCLEKLRKINGNKGADPSGFKGEDKGDHPVENINWEEARVVAGWLTGWLAKQTGSKEGWALGLEASLPTEAQWEYACRAGTQTEYHTGDGVAALDAAGWYEGNSGNSTHPVRQKAMNAFGLFDMHGNVWEWCRDAWDSRAYAKRGAETDDPWVDGPADSPRFNRGGSWLYYPWVCRSAHRIRLHPGDCLWDQGFRLGLSSGPVANQQESKQGAGGAKREAQEWEAKPAEGADGSGATGAATGAGGAGADPWAQLKKPRSGRTKQNDIFNCACCRNRSNRRNAPTSHLRFGHHDHGLAG